MTTRQRIGLVALVLLAGAAACGGDDDDTVTDTTASKTDSTTTEADDADEVEEAAIDDTSLCVLLEPAELDAQFPQAGGFFEGNDFTRLDQCLWVSHTATEVHVGVEPTEVRSMDERLEYGPGEPVAVEGLGDEAYYSGDGSWAVLYVVAGDTALSLQANYIEGVDGAQEKLEALAQLALSRL